MFLERPDDLVISAPNFGLPGPRFKFHDAEFRSRKYIEDIQMFGVNMTFISSSEVKKCIFHESRRHE